MAFFDKRREVSELAEMKQEAVFRLWQLQCDAFEVIDRGMLTDCVSEEQSSNWKKEINQYRLNVQDSFLRETKLSKAKVSVAKANEEFSNATQKVSEQIERAELEIDLPERIARLGRNFTKLFDDAHTQGLITAKDRESVRITVNQHYEALARNLHSSELRSNIRASLLNELVIEYYKRVFILYQEITQRRNQIA
jgi:hypothetical protein